MPKTNIPVGKVMSKPRSQWGTVIPRYDDSGSLSAWQVRYPNPVDHGKKVQKQFKPHQEHEAHVWLENEHHLVDLHTKGIQTWVHPREVGTSQPDDVQRSMSSNGPSNTRCPTANG